MIRLKKLIIAGLLLSLIADSCQTEKQNMPNKEAADGQSMLWRIDRADLKTPSWLFGSMHLMPKSKFVFNEQLRQLVLSVDSVVFEINLNDKKANFNAITGTILPNGQLLSDLYSPEQFDSLETFMLDTLGKSSVEWAYYQNLQPVFVSQTFYEVSFGDSTASYELTFQQLANEHNIPVAGLETADYQVSLLDSIPIEIQANMLLNEMRHYHRDLENLDHLVDLYVTQQIDSMDEDLESDDEWSEYTDMLLNQRNQNWIKPIESFISNAVCFIAVGAGHLPGEQGIIRLLRNEGYILTPIDFISGAEE